MLPGGTAATVDVVAAGVTLAIVLTAIGAYLIHVRRRGRAHFDRVDKLGTTSLVGRNALEMGYWSLQGIGARAGRMGITPNQLTWASLATGMGAGIVVVYGYFGVCSLLLIVSGFFDLFDGMVARATGVASNAGEVLDAAVDRYTEYFLFGGLVLHYQGIPAMQLLTLLALAGSSMVTYSSAKAEIYSVTVKSALMRRHERTTFMVMGTGFASWSIAFVEQGRTTPFGYPAMVAIAVIAVLANVAAVRRLRTVAAGADS